MQGNKKGKGIIISATLCLLVVGLSLMISYGGKNSVESDKIKSTTEQKKSISSDINTPKENKRESIEEIIKSPEQLKINMLDQSSGDFYIGMTRQEAVNRLKQFKFKSFTNQAAQEELNSSTDYIGIHEGKVDFCIYFHNPDNRNIVTGINVSRIPSSNFNDGTPLSKALELLGDEYTLYENNIEFREDDVGGSPYTLGAKHEFAVNDYYVQINSNKGIIYSFIISSMKIEKIMNIHPMEIDLSPDLELKTSDLINCDEESLNDIKNYYYAIHGYKFKSERLLRYFSTQRWYSPKYDNVDKFFTDTDKKNIKLVSEQIKKIK
ncbi:YARHG domain-containing protein [Hathewaya proteolytica DSM 3090]|uniref:YARHG domain-containing protein n=1 Tax=Hathewaya proteolytica DSM 3090 TaxID=1121331 RepID=A0A1M6MRU1_9CLOT|nr:YARHG domain-containing protein [Hathewaya proteolytica]SHJ86100.1 YARHG domain-containing protein [Hathewaya proteolytica DSM 3090]